MFGKCPLFIVATERKKTNIAVIMMQMRRGFYFIDGVKNKKENYPVVPMDMMETGFFILVIEKKTNK
jgi:hypothetical protein